MKTIVHSSVAKSNVQRYRRNKEDSALLRAEEYVNTLSDAITAASMRGYSAISVDVPCLVSTELVSLVLENAGYTVGPGRFVNHIVIRW